jgi:hypothetical protein
LTKPQHAQQRSKWAWIASLRKNTLAVIGAIGVVIGAVLGVIQLVDWLSSINEDPIRVEYQYYNGPMDGVIPIGLDPSTNPSDHLPLTTPSEARSALKDGVAFTDPFAWINVTSQVEDETVSLAPYLVIELTEVTPMPERVNYAVYQPGGGAGGEIDYFVATLSPEREGVFYAPQWTSDTALGSFTPPPVMRKTDDFFTLAPGGETEFFNLGFSMLPGYYYRFRIGVQYTHGGSQGVAWSEEFAAGAPLEATVWLQSVNGGSFDQFGDSQEFEEYLVALDNPLLRPLPRHDEAEIERVIDKQVAIVQKYSYPYTPPDQVN